MKQAKTGGLETTNKADTLGVYDLFGKINKNDCHALTTKPQIRGTANRAVIDIVLALLHPNVSVEGAKTQPS